jgi:hypothetical protein
MSLFPGLDPGLSKVLDARAREDGLTAELEHGRAPGERPELDPQLVTPACA